LGFVTIATAVKKSWITLTKCAGEVLPLGARSQRVESLERYLSPKVFIRNKRSDERFTVWL
jgi:hypothetical protein